jgi:predicted ATP-binding protein involved in virulence
MLINTLHLRDFRCFADLEMDFHEQLTVLVATNGQGKTAILEAISIVLGTFVGAFDLGKAKHIERTDAHYGSRTGSQAEQRYPVSISADLQLSDDRLISIRRELSGPKNKSTIKEAAALTQYGKELQSGIRQEATTTLPVVAYYSTGRLWKAHNLTTRKSLTVSRSLGYEDCLSSASNFAQVQAWITKATLAQLQMTQNNLGQSLQMIQEAVNQALQSEGWRNFHYNIGQEELVMQKGKQEILPVSLLSDGTRAMIELLLFLADGTVAIRLNLAPGDRYRAEETIRVFNLNAASLINQRRQAVQGYISLTEGKSDLSDMEWQGYIAEELQEVVGHAFVTAIRHMATGWLILVSLTAQISGSK